MQSLVKLISASRKLVSARNAKVLNACVCSQFYSTPIQFSFKQKVGIISHGMSQRSITSFFTKTPKKSIESDDANNDDNKVRIQVILFFFSAFARLEALSLLNPLLT